MNETNSDQQPDFDFEYWRDLAVQDPDRFEQTRRQTVEAYISGLEDALTQDRLRRLQWRIDQERHRGRSAMGSCIRLYNMMWRSLNHKFEMLDAMTSDSGWRDGSGENALPWRRARILKFSRETCN